MEQSLSDSRLRASSSGVGSGSSVRGERNGPDLHAYSKGNSVDASLSKLDESKSVKGSASGTPSLVLFESRQPFPRNLQEAGLTTHWSNSRTGFPIKGFSFGQLLNETIRATSERVGFKSFKLNSLSGKTLTSESITVASCWARPEREAMMYWVSS